jgi:sulfane dehydrogenase subunit SoxC
MDRRDFLSVSAIAPIAFSDVTPAPGAGRSTYGQRADTETAGRLITPGEYSGRGSSRAPLADMLGIITPSALFFERHHAGVPTIDPSQHRLFVGGLVERPLVFSMDDLKRLPSVSRIHFIECAGNSGSEHAGQPGETPQKSHGLLSCAEWTGVPLRELLKRVGVSSRARWVYAEGADACRLARSIPLDKCVDDVLVVFGQNGEALRPEQGYPLRLLVPGWEGNINIKWLRQLRLVDQPVMTKDEAASYTDLQPDGRARQFTFVMEAKSVITRPAGGQQLRGAGLYELTGLAWSGRGTIRSVAVTLDGGRMWRNADLQTPILPQALTRFRLSWEWDGKPCSFASRCEDETGYVQPTRETLIAARGMSEGPDGNDHYNGIKWWRIDSQGVVTHV